MTKNSLNAELNRCKPKDPNVENTSENLNFYKVFMLKEIGNLNEFYFNFIIFLLNILNLKIISYKLIFGMQKECI